ncbi:MAG TPA: hypothetical protein VKT49_00430 [Bryobacteraceae bacterium]|nr:hypothetical protein [Bryobacteraceae bacterium]
MSVWPTATPASSTALCGSEGELVSISVPVEPRDLERLLEALATLEFPINPQIYHDATVVYVAGDGTERAEPATLVEFPAYADQVRKMRSVLEASGFTGEAVSVASMLEDMHGGERVEAAPAGANYDRRILRKSGSLTRKARQ